ncbi:MAG: GAF domain-containing SpoIIE family protein phosphatase [Actinomycetota bacterium]
MVREASERMGGHATDAEHVAELERTLESLREDSEVAHVLLGLSGALAEVRTVEETLEKGVRIARELFGAGSCFAAVWDGATGRFHIVTRYGHRPGPAETIEGRGEPRSLPLLLDALSGRQPILVDDVESDDRIPLEEAHGRALKAYIGIPLRWGHDFGGVGLEFSQAQRFGPRETALARGIARQMGVALANARRFNLLQSLRGIGLRVGSPLQLTAVIREVAAGAMELLGGSGALLYFKDGNTGELIAAGGAGIDHGVYELLGRLAPDDEAWAELFAGGTTTVGDLRSYLGTDEGPRSAVGTVISGSESALLGAVIVTFDRLVALGPDEDQALSVMVAQAASAIANAQRYERQRRVARSLQAGLLSTDMPSSDSFEIHATYEAASSEADVGGDFYDAFDLTDGSVAMVVGDVSGKGAEAAAHTAMAKYMLRAFSMRNPGPESVLFHLNNALCRGLAEDKFTTLFYAVYDPRMGTLSFANGGHPNPLLYRARTTEVESVRAEGGILGAFENQRFGQAKADLYSGDVVVSYTDGLIETRADDGELYGTERVAESLRRHAGVPADQMTRAIYQDAHRFGSVTDDTVVFALVMTKDDGV